MVAHAPPVHRFRAWTVRRRTTLLAVVAALVLAGIALLWGWSYGGERRALERMPPADRAAFYRETRATTESVCRRAAVDPDLHARCVDSAEFLMSFPECDNACQSFARGFITQPAR